MIGRSEIEAAVIATARDKILPEDELRARGIDPDAAVLVLGNLSRGILDESVADDIGFVPRERVALSIADGLVAGFLVGLRLASTPSTGDPVG